MCFRLHLWLKFCRSVKKFFYIPFFSEIAWKKNFECLEKNFVDLFFGEHLRLCSWSLALASSIPVLGLERVCPRKSCRWLRIFLRPWPWPHVLDSTSVHYFQISWIPLYENPAYATDTSIVNMKLLHKTAACNGNILTIESMYHTGTGGINFLAIISQSYQYSHLHTLHYTESTHLPV